MNQREYSWEEKEITKFLDDIFKIYEEDKYVLINNLDQVDLLFKYMK